MNHVLDYSVTELWALRDKAHVTYRRMQIDQDATFRLAIDLPARSSPLLSLL